MRKLIDLYRTAFFTLVIGLFMQAGSAYAQTADLGIRVGEYDKYTRVVFDWSKLVGYSVDQTSEGIDLTFNVGARGGINPPALAAAFRIQSIDVISSTDERTQIRIKTSSAATYKDFRIVRRVVLDVYGQKSSASRPQQPAPSAQVEEDLPTASIEKPSTKPDDIRYGPNVEAAPVSPVEVVESDEQPPGSSDPQVSDASLEDRLAQAISGNGQSSSEQISVDRDENNEAVDEETRQPTVITVSMIEPTGLAVFNRFGYLWLVMDSSLSTIEPERFGPLAMFLGRPDVYEVDGGVAYRYKMPDGQHVTARRENLAWQILLTEGRAPEFSDAYIEAEFNQSGQEPKLVAFMKGIRKGIMVKDPVVGDVMFVVPTRNTGQAILDPVQSPDVQALKTYLGFVAVPRRDDVRFTVSSNRNEVHMSAPGGLNLTSASNRIAEIKPFLDPAEKNDGDEERLFNLRAWQKGGSSSFSDNRQEYLDILKTLTEDQEIADAMLQMALLHFANGFGHETLGYLNVVKGYNEGIEERPSFLAIRGAANALAGRYEEAISDLETPALQHQAEAKLWRGYAAAATEQWSLAESLFPRTNALLDGYPQKLAVPLTLYMAESALRSGDPQRASNFLESLDVFGEGLETRHRAALKYLRGEMYRQNDQPEKALTEWKWVMTARDRLYSSKARLAQTMLTLSEGMISEEQALERLENMRFAWRDDGLETQILQNIGMLRIKTGRYYDGLVQLREAIRLASYNLIDTEFIIDDMTAIFRQLFVNGGAKNIPALEAITIYNEFPELKPAGQDGITAALTFAEYLVRVDLLRKAAETMENVLTDRAMTNAQIPGLGARLAAIYLLDAEPNSAISALQRTGRSGMSDQLRTERRLLRARALSQLGMVDEAIAALEDMNTKIADRLRADIYWRANDWDKSAMALFRLMPNPNSTERLAPQEAAYVLNAAVALKLSGDSDKLSRLKNDFSDLMQRTAIANSFNVVTRTAGRTTLGDRETMLNIAGEVDIFKGFLDSYKEGDNGGS